MICTHHNHLTHLHFTNKITGSFRQQKCEREGFFFYASIEVPFDKVRDELDTNVERDENYTKEHLEKLDELNKHNICHQNTKSMSSTFGEFQFMINQTNFDVITLSEAWLKNDKYLIEYVILSGYEIEMEMLNMVEA